MGSPQLQSTRVFVSLRRGAQVYADRYLELLDYPAELSVANAASGFQISVRMTSPDFGPYACLVFHDPVATPLTIGELQQQYSGSYSDFTTSQVTHKSCVSVDKRKTKEGLSLTP